MKKIVYAGFLVGIAAFFPWKVNASNFAYYRTLTVTSTASVASGTNSNFPALVSLGLSSLSASSSPSGTDVFLNNATWTAPAGISAVMVKAWAGGGGGGLGTLANGGGSGGGGGGFAQKNVASVTAGNSYTISVGAGGQGSTGLNAATGTDSWFNTTSTVWAIGGGAGLDKRGAAGKGVASSTEVGDLKQAGGTGGVGQSTGGSALGGGGGGGAGTLNDGGVGSGATGVGGAGGLVGGGPGGNDITGSIGAPGTINGGGGAGGAAASSLNGGAGANGEVDITYQSGKIQNLCNAPNGGQEPCDLVFATSSSNCNIAPLNFEIESYTSSTGALVAWVSVPTMATGTVIYMCYGDATTLTDNSHPSSTWDANFRGVWHLRDGTTLSGKDSTSNVNNGTTVTASSTAGKTDGAASFNGTTQTVTLDETGSLNFTGAQTLEAWFYEVTNSNYRAVVANGGASTRSGSMYLVSGSLNSIYYSNVGAQTLSNSWFLNSWNHLVLTDDGTNLKIYLNGILSYSGVNGTGANGTALHFGIGYNVDDTDFPMNGNIDEARISNATRNSQWILTEYNNQNSPSTFYSVSAETPFTTASGEGDTLIFLRNLIVRGLLIR